MISILGTLLLSNVTVSLPAEVTVAGAEMTLGEVATIEGDDPAEVERVRAFSLGYAPSPGYSRVFEGWKIGARLHREFRGFEIDLAGKNTCRVFPATATVKGEDLERAAREALDILFAGEDVTIRTTMKLHDEVVPKGIEGIKLLAEPRVATLQSGPWSVPVQIVVDDVPYRTVWTSFETELYRVMPVLRRDVALGEKIQRGDIIPQRAPVQGVAGWEPLTEEMLVGATARRLLEMGKPVGSRDVARQIAIKKGETVALEVHNGAIVVNTNVLAAQDGYLGDVVLIQVFGSGKELTAKVIGTGRLALTLDQVPAIRS